MPRWMKWAIALAVGFAIIVFGWRMSSNRWLGLILPTFFVINCFVLIVVVLLQSGKAADLAGAFGGAGSQTAFGPRGAANALSNATTWCAIMFMVCAFALTVRSDKAASQGGSVLQKVSQPAPKPAVPATAPIVPQSNTHDSLPTGQQPGSQTPASSQPAQSQPQSSQPASGQQPPASSQPAPVPTPTKKP